MVEKWWVERLCQWMTRHFSLMFGTGLVIGLVFQGLAEAVRPLIAAILMVVMYLSFLRVRLSGLGDELRQWRRLLWMVLFLQVLLPAAVYGVLRLFCHLLGWEAIWADAGLLMLLVPAGVGVPMLCLLLHGHYERGVLLLVTTALLVPLTMPLMLWLLRGSIGDLSPMAMMRFLAMMMLGPAAVAMFTRRLAPRIGDALQHHSSVISVLGLTVLIIGAVAGLQPVILQTPVMAVKGVVVTTLAMVVAFAVSWAVGGSTPQDRLTLAIAGTWTNIGLAIVTASQIYAESAPLILLGVTLGEIPWNLLFPPLQWFAARRVKPVTVGQVTVRGSA